MRHPAALAQASKGKSVPAFGSTHGSRIHLDRSDLCWRLVSMPRDEPGFVVARGELDERGTQLFDRIEVFSPNRFSFKVRMKRSATPLPSGSRTKEGEASCRRATLCQPRSSSSRWLRDVLQLWPYQSALPVRLLEGQLTGASRDIGEKAQRDACFLSELTSGDLTRIYDGHELEEYRTRPVTGTPCNPLESRGYFSLSLNWWSSASKLDFRFSSLDFQVWSVDINFCRSSSCSRVRYSSSS